MKECVHQRREGGTLGRERAQAYSNDKDRIENWVEQPARTVGEEVGMFEI